MKLNGESLLPDEKWAKASHYFSFVVLRVVMFCYFEESWNVKNDKHSENIVASEGLWLSGLTCVQNLPLMTEQPGGAGGVFAPQL